MSNTFDRSKEIILAGPGARKEAAGTNTPISSVKLDGLQVHPAVLSKLLTSLEVINTPLETPIIIVVIS